MDETRYRLSDADLALDPRERLRRAATNVHYVIEDIGEPQNVWDELKHHDLVTPVHEAGHAVAQTLAGRRVAQISYSPWGGRKHLGQMKVEAAARFDTEQALVEGLGPHGLAREVVDCFAGPIAELRIEPSRVAGGFQQDRMNAENLCKLADFEGFGDRFEWQKYAGAKPVACSKMREFGAPQ